MAEIGFLRWVSSTPTGGNVYDDELAAGLRRRGLDVHEHQAAGRWPDGSASERAAVADMLLTRQDWLVDGIVACAAPEVVAAALARGQRVTIVVHMCLGDEWGLSATTRRRYVDSEARSFGLPVGVVCTSHWTAGELRRRYGRTEVTVAVPGVRPASPAHGSEPARLLGLASITPTKDQLTLVSALARLTDLSWTACLVGADQVEPGYAAEVRSVVGRAGLTDRVRITGPLLGSRLDTEWREADLLVLPSRTESYGIVVAEALARGIPSLVTAGTGAVEAQNAGLGPHTARAGSAVPAGDVDAWATALRHWLTDRDLRHRWRAAALARRPQLPSWDDTAAAVAAHLLRSPRHV